jgi:Domain of unknown function (DUF1707)
MDGVVATQRMLLGKVACRSRKCGVDTDHVQLSAQLIEGSHGAPQGAGIDPATATCCCRRGARFRIDQLTRSDDLRLIPQLCGRCLEAALGVPLGSGAMDAKGRIPAWRSRGTPQLISDLDRKSAIRELAVFHERGFIDDAELARRVEQVESATTARELERLFVDLRDGRRGRRTVRATDHERAAALRRLTLHHEAGQMSPEEYRQRKVLIDEATVPQEITAALTELPALRPPKQTSGERLASDAERTEAERRLDREYVAGRLNPEEHARRIETVRDARTRNEIQSAFTGLASDRMEKPIQTVSKVGSGIVRGGIILARGLLIFGWALFIALVVVVWQVTGMDATVPLLITGVATFLLLVMLLAPGALSGRRSRT